MADFDSDDQRRAFFGKLAAGTLGARKAKTSASKRKTLAEMRDEVVERDRMKRGESVTQATARAASERKHLESLKSPTEQRVEAARRERAQWQKWRSEMMRTHPTTSPLRDWYGG